VLFFEVGGESLRTSFPATGAAYGPLEIPRQQFFFDLFRTNRLPSKFLMLRLKFQLLEIRRKNFRRGGPDWRNTEVLVGREW